MSRERNIWLALRGFVVVILSFLIVACATSPVVQQQLPEGQTRPIFESCAVVQDQELAEMRGCYDNYSFGMNVTGNFDLASKNFSIQTYYTQVANASQIPSQLNVNSTGSMVSYNNGSVAFTAGVGQNSLGSGIMQVIQVAGSNVMVVANMDVTLNINHASIKPTAGSMISGALSGMSTIIR